MDRGEEGFTHILVQMRWQSSTILGVLREITVLPELNLGVSAIP